MVAYQIGPEIDVHRQRAEIANDADEPLVRAPWQCYHHVLNLTGTDIAHQVVQIAKHGKAVDVPADPRPPIIEDADDALPRRVLQTQPRHQLLRLTAGADDSDVAHQHSSGGQLPDQQLRAPA